MWSGWKTAMAGRDGGGSRGAAPLIPGLVLLSALGCATGGGVADPVALPPVSESAAELPPPTTQGEEPVATPPPPTVVVIDAGGSDAEGPKSLADAAREERERRAQATKPVAVIDNRNLAEFSKGQTLTIAEGPNAATPEESPARAAGETAGGPTRDEAYWRNRGLEIRRQWRESADRVTELEAKSEELRRRFYAADDPYQRDSQIKPEWDHTLDELDSTRREVERAELDLERYLGEGRQAGALPGWLREGSELEPERRVLKTPNAEPTEPVELEEPRDPS